MLCPIANKESGGLVVNFKELPPVKEQIRKCVRCGRCRTVCPVFAEVKNETVAPRGHVFMVQMLRDGVVKPGADVYERLSNCLLCETCSAFCPSGIDIHELNAAARSFITENQANPAKRFVFDTLWTSPTLLRASTALMWGAHSTGLTKLARSLGLTRMLPGDLPKAERILDRVPFLSARDRLADVTPAEGKQKFRVVYFLGCATNLLRPEVALATVKVLSRYGCEVIIPKDLRCCGLPHIANGKMSTARSLVLHNFDVMSRCGADYIVTDCASCSSALSEKNVKFVLGQEELEAPLTQSVNKVMDLTAFLVNVIGINPGELVKRSEVRVTYHDPCHLAKAQNITKEPRQLLRSIAGVELIEMSEADRCCGGSGTFALTHYDMSMKILDKKMASIKTTACDTVATCCPSCSMQLAHGLKRNQLSGRVLHPVELLAQTLP